METTLYNFEGKEAGKIMLPRRLFAEPWNADLVHQVITTMRQNLRRDSAHVKDRGEVRGGGKKPWKQKGTGRARHGSIRSPLWRGGGVTHGPNKIRPLAPKINRKVKIKAMMALLSQKLRDQEIIFVDRLPLTEPKTKQAAGFLRRLATIPGYDRINFQRGRRALVIVPEITPPLTKSFSNIASAEVCLARLVSPLDLAFYRYLIIIEPALAVKILEDRLG